MIHIEEAKNKICPMMTHQSSNLSHQYSAGFGEALTNLCKVLCRTSDCMMWRWEEHRLINSTYESTGITFPGETPPKVYSTTHGYCGLIK